MTTTAPPPADTTGGFPPGTLVTVRGREWVVQNGSTDTVLRLRPVAGADDDLTAVLPALESVQSASFDPPTLNDLGPAADTALLRDAFRIAVTDPAGPFRGFGRIAVRPRPYQLVPLLMALRLLGVPDDEAYRAVRMLVADDVGIGKTIESLLIANELLTTGEADGLAVVCPPHLSDQWVAELRDHFHLDAVKVGPSTVRTLETGLATGESLFDRHRVTVVSLDWVKSRRRRDEFAQAAPNCVIVDEAHLCARDDVRTGRHLRHELLVRLASEPLRHLLLVTATPHSGKEGAFRSLIGLLHPRLAAVASDTELSADERELLARHFIARKRVDVANYLGETSFPERLELDTISAAWQPSVDLDTLIREVIDWARPRLAETEGDARRRRVWWWSMLGLGRALGSSPRAAAASFRSRAGVADLSDAATEDDVDETGRQMVADVDTDLDEADDIEAGAVVDDDMAATFERFARRVDAMEGPGVDTKLDRAIAIARDLLDREHNPIVFCRFISTAEYVAEHLDGAVDAAVVAVTGHTPPDVRADDVAVLASHPRRVLVATDCLSEGINLQEGFDAVVHYDLPWSPTRLEQREGRVDRYGQPAEIIRVATMQGGDPTLDPFIQTHLIDKHHAIKQRLGFSIPVPGITDTIIDAAASAWFGDNQLTFDIAAVTKRWEDETERQLEWTAAGGETVSRAKYAQRTIDPSQVADMVEAADTALGNPAETARFVITAVQRLDGTAAGDPDAAADPDQPDRHLALAFGAMRPDVRADLAAVLGLGRDELTELAVRFARPAPTVVGDTPRLVLDRTHPLVTELARRVSDPAMDRHLAVGAAPAARMAVATTDQVDTRTWLMTVRCRHDLETQRRRRRDDGTYETFRATHLVEDVTVAGIRRDQLLDADTVNQLVDAAPTTNTHPADRDRHATTTVDRLTQGRWDQLLAQVAQARGELLENQHDAARTAVAGGRGMGAASVHPHDTVDVLSVICLVPDRSS